MYQKILLHLDDLNDSSIDIESSALLSIDGLVMATTLPSDMEVEHIGAICASMFKLGYYALGKCTNGMLDHVLIKGEKNKILIINAGSEIMLIVIVKPQTDLEALFPCVRNGIEKIAATISNW